MRTPVFHPKPGAEIRQAILSQDSPDPGGRNRALSTLTTAVSPLGGVGAAPVEVPPNSKAPLDHVVRVCPSMSTPMFPLGGRKLDRLVPAFVSETKL